MFALLSKDHHNLPVADSHEQDCGSLGIYNAKRLQIRLILLGRAWLLP